MYFKRAALADLLWKDLVALAVDVQQKAKLWKLIDNHQTLRLSSPPEGITSSPLFNRWRQNPGKFSKKYPREGKMLKDIWDTFQKV